MMQKLSSFRMVELIAGIAACSLASACGGKGPSPEVPLDEGVAPEAENPSPYAVYPEDAEFLAGVSVSAITESGLWAHYGELVLETTGASGVLAQIREACGFDPLAAIEGVTIGGKLEHGEVLFAVSGLSRDQVVACGQGGGEAFSFTEEGELLHYARADVEVWMGWSDERMLVASDAKAYLERRLSEKGLSDQSPLVQLVEHRIDREAGMWWVSIPTETSPFGRGFTSSGADTLPTALYATLAPTEVLAVEVGLDFPGADDAAQMHAQTNEFLQMARTMAGELGALVGKVETERRDARFLARVTLDADDVALIAEQVAATMNLDASAGGDTANYSGAQLP